MIRRTGHPLFTTVDGVTIADVSQTHTGDVVERSPMHVEEGAGSGSSAAPRIVAAGNLGAAYTVVMEEDDSEVIVNGTLTANCTLSVTGLVAGQSITLRLTQDGTGSRLVTFPAGTRKPGGALTLSTTPGALDVVTMFSPDGTTFDAFLAGPNMLEAAVGSWTPADISTAVAWLKADEIEQADGAQVATWPDLIASYDAVQATSGQQPTLQTNELNGKAVVRFDGTDDRMSIPGLIPGNTDAADMTLIVVAKATSTADNRTLLSTRDTTSGFLLRLETGGTSGIYGHLGSTNNTFAITAANWNLLELSRDGLTSTAYVNGTATTPFVHGAFTASTRGALDIGARNDGTPQHFMLGDIAEIVVCTGILTTDERAELATYIEAEYGLVIA